MTVGGRDIGEVALLERRWRDIDDAFVRTGCIDDPGDEAMAGDPADRACHAVAPTGGGSAERSRLHENTRADMRSDRWR